MLRIASAIGLFSGLLNARQKNGRTQLGGECSQKSLSFGESVARIIRIRSTGVYATNVYIKAPPKRGHSHQSNNHRTARNNHSSNHADSGYAGKQVNSSVHGVLWLSLI